VPADRPLVMGIETSCDETGVGIVHGTALLADAIASSVDSHARFGGVVPEIAARAHLEAMVPMVDRALSVAGVGLADLDAIAVTAGPGLAGALLVGVAAAKAYALALGKPLYGVNHLAAHIAVDVLEHGPLPEPAIALLVSGGHSSLLLVESVTEPARPLGATVDDAVGEAFDKVARLLGLPFPGGPHIERVARDGSLAGEPVPVADVAASFQEAAVDVLTVKAVRACREYGVGSLLIGGGVAANSRLRELAGQRCAEAGVSLRVPRPALCTDNGAMVAALGSLLVSDGVVPSALDLSTDPSMPVTRVLR